MLLDFLKKFYLYPRYLIEFLFVFFIFVFCNLIGFRLSSFLIGNLFLIIGSIIPQSNRIKNNLRFIYPLMEEALVKSLTKKIWFNCGRHVGEMFNMKFKKWKNLKKYINVKNEELPLEILIKFQKPCIILSSHIGNWWFISKFLSYKNIKVNGIYRNTNNSFITFFYPVKNNQKIKKGSKEDFKKLLNKINSNSNEVISILQDHRDRDGIRISLLGKDAMTSTFFAKLAIKYKINVIYSSCVRDKINPLKFKMKFKNLYNAEIDTFSIEELVILANKVISEDINENREQWFWLHKRWKM